MILKNGSYEEFVSDVRKSGKKIVVYGAGMIGKILAPYILHAYGISSEVLCYVDQDKRKTGKELALNTGTVFIESFEALKKEKKGYVLLITNSNFQPVIEMFDRMTEFDDVEAYILPIMQLTSCRPSGDEEETRAGSTQMIPKKIHYCWFSGKQIPDVLKRCIETWERFCPDYEIIRWDESNYDVCGNMYMRQAYEQQKWGFIPDIARLDILYRHGGIYLDTDVELIRNLDELLYQPAFCGTEKWGNVNFGGCSGAAAGNPVIKEILDFRKDVPFINEDGTLNMETCGYYETTPLIRRGMKVNNETQAIGGLKVYASDYFHPFDYMSGETEITPNTFSIHYFSGSWLPEDSREKRRRTRQAYQNILKRMNG